MKNCFLTPTEKYGTVDKGEVSMKMLESLGFQNIRIRLLLARKVYSLYLAGNKMDIKELGL